MPIQIPSYIKNPPQGSKVTNPSVHASPQNVNPNPKRSKVRMLLFLLALVLIGGAVGYYFFFYKNDNIENNTNLVVANSNSNQNTNQNSNSVINSNINSNLNTNKIYNINFDENLNENLNINLNENTNFIDDFSLYKLNTDTDGDGLFDIIEGWYGTLVNKIDSDNDGFSDFTEIEGCYDPLGNGKMSLNTYTNYCNNILKKLSEQSGYNLSSQNVKTICTYWEDSAQEVIDSVNQYQNVDNVEDNDVSCEKTTNLTNNEDVCKDMYFILIGLCNNEGLKLLTL